MMKKVFIKKGLRLTFKGKLSLILFLISSATLVALLLFYFEEQKMNNEINNLQLLYYILSILFIYVSIINLQQIFNDKVDLNTLKNIGGDDHKYKEKFEFFVKNGFKRIFLYFWPTVLYIAFLFYSTLPFIMGMDNGYFVFALFWLMLSFSALLVLYIRFNMLSSFLIVFDKTLVVRNKLKTYYFDIYSFSKILYITKGSRIHSIFFKEGYQTIAKVEFTYLKRQKKEIHDKFKRFDHLEFESKAKSSRSRANRNI